MHAPEHDNNSSTAVGEPVADSAGRTRSENLRRYATVLIISFGLIAWLTGAWVEPCFDWVAGFFTFPGHPLLQIRRPSQLPLFAWHTRILIALLGLVLVIWPRCSAERRWLWAAVLIGYALRAAVWCIGGNLPIVPGDSAHHWCIADAVYHGQGPTLDYVASFFRVYPRWGMVDDWSMPLYSVYLAGAFSVAGSSIAVAKTATFLINLATIPSLFFLARRAYGARVAVGSAMALAVFPPHVLYASLMLKESLAIFCCVTATHLFLRAWRAQRWPLPCASAGVMIGLMILSRRTCLAVSAAMLLYCLLTPAKHRWRRLLVLTVTTIAVLIPWAWVTYRDYGVPLYSYTNYFKYTPDWTIHFRERGVPSLEDYLSQPLFDLLNGKCVAACLVAVYFWFIFTPPLALAYFSRFRRKWRLPLPRLSLLVFLAFVGGTLVNVASLDQVRDFGRYFPVALTLMIPVAVATLKDAADWMSARGIPAKRGIALLAVLVVSCFWSAYGWTRNYNFLSDMWHVQFARYMTAAQIIQAELPPDAVVMALHPWEVHMLTDRRTVLMPHQLNPQRLREEIETYGVTHVVLDAAMGRSLLPIVQEFGISLPPDFARRGVGVYPVQNGKPDMDERQKGVE